MRLTPRYSEQFKIDAVELLKNSDKSYRQVADDLGVSDESLRSWYKRFEMAKRRKRSAKVVAEEKVFETSLPIQPGLRSDTSA